MASRDEARRRADEALAILDRAVQNLPASQQGAYFYERFDQDGEYLGSEPVQTETVVQMLHGAIDEARALLASEPAKAPFVSRNEEWGLRPDFTTAGVTAPPAGAEPAKGACADCGGCGGLGWIPAGDEQLGCIDCNGKGTIEPAPPADAEVARLTALLRECNAVCLCGCPESEHEADECGESCGHDNHECIRVPRAVLAYVERLRSTPPPPSDAVREAAENLRRLALQGAIDAPEVLDEINSLLAALSRPAPAPAVPPAVREAAERADKAMRDVFGGVDRFGDYCGHPMIPGKLAHAVAALLAALGGKLEGKGGAS